MKPVKLDILLVASAQDKTTYVEDIALSKVLSIFTPSTIAPKPLNLSSVSWKISK